MASEAPQPATPGPNPPAQQNISIEDRFRIAEMHFNMSFLKLVENLFDAAKPTDDEDEKNFKEKDHKNWEILTHAYTFWLQEIGSNPKHQEPVKLFCAATEECCDMLIEKDQRLFKQKKDFFAEVFCAYGMDSYYLYKCLKPTADCPDPKLQLWIQLISLYRLAVVINYFMHNSLIRDILSAMFVDNFTFTDTNFVPHMYDLIGRNRPLRRKMLKLIDGDKHTFEHLFTNMRRVLASFNADGEMDAKMKQSIEQFDTKMNQSIDQLLQDHGFVNLPAEDRSLIVDALSKSVAGGSSVLDPLVLQGIVEDKVAAEKLRTDYIARGIPRMNVGKFMGMLSKNMDIMSKGMNAESPEDAEATMAALESGMAEMGMTEQLAKMREEMEADIAKNPNQLNDDYDDENDEKDGAFV